MITAPLFALALALQPPPFTNFELAVQCAATLKVGTQGINGPNAREAARLGEAFAETARDLGQALSRNTAERMGQYETILTVTKTSDPARFAAGLEACRSQGAIHFPAPSETPPAEPAPAS